MWEKFLNSRKTHGIDPRMNFILNPIGGKRTTVILRLAWIKIYQPWSRHKFTLCGWFPGDFLSRNKI